MNRLQPLEKLSLQSIFYLYIIWTAFGIASPVQGQITPDNTLGAETSRLNQNQIINGELGDEIEGGARRGSNLFHSFSEFNINQWQSVYFANPSGVDNILTRVTGGKASNIFGTLGVNGTANLFLINPAGLVFGQNARLDLQGSFVGTTANGVQFGNQELFSATNPQTPSLLAVNVPVGLQYGSNPGAIQVQGASLQVPDGKTLTLAGGSVNIDGGQLLGPGGRIELAGVATPGEVGLAQQGQEWRLSLPDGLARADVAIGNDAIMNVRAGGSGSIVITARNFTGTGEGTRVRAGIAADSGIVGAQAGDIDINTTETVNLNESGVFNTVQTGGTGNAGDINMTTGSLSFINGAEVNASTASQGNAGNIKIMARDAVSIDGLGSDEIASGAFSVVNPGAIGQGGDISITTRILFLTNGGLISASTLGKGDAGNLKITARDAVSIDGLGSNGLPSRALSAVVSRSIGQGGDISITTGVLSLTNGGLIGTSTQSEGDAGKIKITARDAVSIDGLGSNELAPSGVFSRVNPGGVGQGGKITVNTGLFSITNRGELSVSSEGQGDAGNLDVTARQLRLDNQGAIQAQTASGQGGNIELQVQNLLLRRGSFISTNAGNGMAGGDGGNITIDGKFIVAFPNENSDISANAFSGNGGNITINSRGIFGSEYRPKLTDKSDITASSEFGVSGLINLNTPDNSAIQNSFTQVSPNVIDTNALIANSCISRANQRQENSFTITGSGALRNSPGDVLMSDYSTGEVRNIEPASRPWKKGDPIIEAQGLYRLPDGQLILSQECG